MFFELLFSFDWFGGLVTEATFFRGNTHGDWANRCGLSAAIVMLIDRSIPSCVGGSSYRHRTLWLGQKYATSWLIQDSACAYLSGARQIGAINNLHVWRLSVLILALVAQSCSLHSCWW